MATVSTSDVLGDEIAKLLTTLVKLQLGSQSEAILQLHRIGFGPTRIAELLGTTANTVNVAIQKKRSQKSVPSKVAADG